MQCLKVGGKKEKATLLVLDIASKASFRALGRVMVHLSTDRSSSSSPDVTRGVCRICLVGQIPPRKHVLLLYARTVDHAD